MKKLILFIILFILSCSFALGVSVQPHSTTVIKINVEDYKIENLPITLHSTSYKQMCELCNRYEECCDYCSIPKCSSNEILTSEKGAMADIVGNLKYEKDFKTLKGNKFCPIIEIKKDESCVQTGIIDTDYDVFWYSINEYNFTSEKYLWRDNFNKDILRYEIDNKFKIIEKTKARLISSNNKIINANDVEIILDKKDSISRNISIENESGTVLFTKYSVFSKTKYLIMISLIIILLIIIIVLTYIRYKTLKNKKKTNKSVMRGLKKR
ncbi:hypothetical protein KY321_02615 [Candidatus Woesearchaeota archaeon]|nr:hypothetical protein [Candidatus Woesearchaeota archaeon]